MRDSVSFNIGAATSARDVDALNRDFYSRFNYPWLPLLLPKAGDGAFWPAFVNQEIGDFTHARLAPECEIWVAGCGTNQAVLTALKYPQARVLGTDVSTRSLEVCSDIAAQLGITNLTLEEASLNEVRHEARFDHVICTGVIHHNADPAVPLNALARGLKPDGILELMVYNYYHRTHTTAYQKAIRLLGGQDGKPAVDVELPITMELVAGFEVQNSMRDFLVHQRDLPEAAVADSLLQPVEFSYTVETLRDLCHGAGLQLLQPCINQFDKLSGQIEWEIDLPQGAARARYETLGDLDRWQVSNLLLVEKSPMLWFYVQRRDSRHPRKTQREIVAQFLDTVFMPAQGSSTNFVLNPQSRYQEASRPTRLPMPPQPADPRVREVFAACDGRTRMADILASGAGGYGRDPGDPALNRLRVLLTTPAYPYLVARGAAGQMA
ncbi:MAG: class I SAM-dependent methyltransferase [Proteobacteria bacterium]|nr:class I SAM-dependent methyltransferase [Pseudomonadota bacterium]